MVRYATGIHARAVCDICGLEYPYLSLQTQWDNLRACPECFDPKHPQIKPRVVSDRTALYQPRPGTNSREDAKYRTRFGFEAKGIVADTVVVSLGATPSSISSTTAVGSESIQSDTYKSVTGIASTTAVGTEVPTAQIPETGLAATGAVGTISIRADASITETGLSTTVAVGNEIPMSAAIETGLAATGAVGDANIALLGWGNGLWGESNDATDAWGN